MIVSSKGLRGINTCDMVVDGNGNAIDCSSIWNLTTLACWNPISPCAASGSVAGSPATIDNSLSQLGPIAAGILEGGGAGSGDTNNFMGFSYTTLLMIGVGVGALVLLTGRR